jgi:hypothetical protein
MHAATLLACNLIDGVVLQPQVVGSLTAGEQWDDEDDSIDDDTATDGGEVSRIGSDASAGFGGGMDAGLGGAGGRFSNGSGLDDGYDGGMGPPESEDSGF